MKKMFERMKRRWIAYLVRLEKANTKQFGSQRLDCCDLHADKETPRR